MEAVMLLTLFTIYCLCFPNSVTADRRSSCPEPDGWTCTCTPGTNRSILAADCTTQNAGLNVLLESLHPSIMNLTFRVDLLQENGTNFLRFRQLQKLEIVWTRPPSQLPHAGEGRIYDFQNRGLFEGLLNLKILSINIPTRHITPTLLRPLERLQVLNLSYTGFLNTSGLSEIFTGSRLNEKPLTTVLLKRMSGVDPNRPRQFNFKDMFPSFDHLNITHLDISENGDVYFYPGIIEYLPYVKEFKASKINIRFNEDQPEQVNCLLVEIVFHQHLKLFDLSHIDLVGFGIELPKGPFMETYVKTWFHCMWKPNCLCHTHQKMCGHLFPSNLTCANFPGFINPMDIIDVSGTCEFHVRIPVPRQLEKLYTRNTQYTWSYGKWKLRNECFGPNVIKAFDFSFVKFPLSSSGIISLTGFNDLEEFIVENSDWGNAFVNPKFLHTMPSLRKLNLCGTTTGVYIANDTNLDIFKTSQNLSELYLCNARISVIPSKEFSFLTNLTHLDLSGNKLKNISFDATDVTLLSHFNVSNNMLQNLSKVVSDVLEANSRNHNVSVDLSGNILSCNCDSLEFLKWINVTKVRFVNKSQYLCYHQDGLRSLVSVEEHIDLLISYCFPPPDYTLYISVSVASLLSIIVCSLALLVYRFRWKIRFVCLWLKHRRQLKEDGQHYKFDAFVVYSDEDRYWVHQVLLPKLEKDRRLKLCVHFRDFVPGHNIEEQIVSSINASRKTIIVVSPHLLKSNWCEFEMQIARNRLYSDGLDVIVPIILIDCPKETLTTIMKNIISTTTYIKWQNDNSYEEYFWKSVTLAIGSRVSQVPGNGTMTEAPSGEE